MLCGCLATAVILSIESRAYAIKMDTLSLIDRPGLAKMDVLSIRLAFPRASAQDNGLPSQMSYGSHLHEEPSKHEAIKCNLYHVFSVSKSCVQCTKMINKDCKLLM